MIHAANKTRIYVLQDYDTISSFLIHKLNKLTDYELCHQQLMSPGDTCKAFVDKCNTGVLHLHCHPMHNSTICHEMIIMKTLSCLQPEISISKFGEQFSMDFEFMSTKENNQVGYNCYLLIGGAILQVWLVDDNIKWLK